MDLKTISIIVIVLVVFHFATIIVIRLMSGDTFSGANDIGAAMTRLKRERPIAHGLYVTSLALPLVEFGVVAVMKLWS